MVATNCEQTYHRYLTLGDHLYATSRLDSVSPRKKTALGEGYFLTSITEYRDQHGELVGEMSFRTLWFKPAQAHKATRRTAQGGVMTRPQPVIGRDNAYYWEGVAKGERADPEMHSLWIAAASTVAHVPGEPVTGLDDGEGDRSGRSPQLHNLPSPAAAVGGGPLCGRSHRPGYGRQRCATSHRLWDAWHRNEDLRIEMPLSLVFEDGLVFAGPAQEGEAP